MRPIHCGHALVPQAMAHGVRRQIHGGTIIKTVHDFGRDSQLPDGVLKFEQQLAHADLGPQRRQPNGSGGARLSRRRLQRLVRHLSLEADFTSF